MGGSGECHDEQVVVPERVRSLVAVSEMGTGWRFPLDVSACEDVRWLYKATSSLPLRMNMADAACKLSHGRWMSSVSTRAKSC